MSYEEALHRKSLVRESKQKGNSDEVSAVRSRATTVAAKDDASRSLTRARSSEKWQTRSDPREKDHSVTK